MENFYEGIGLKQKQKKIGMEEGGGSTTAMAASTTTQSSGGGERRVVKGDDQQKVSFFKLFSFADRFDVVLMVVGTIAAMGNGVSQPLMTLIFGQLINSFGSSNKSNVIDEVSKV